MLPTFSVVLSTSGSASIGWSVARCSLASWRGIEPQRASIPASQHPSIPAPPAGTSPVRAACSRRGYLLSPQRQRSFLQVFPSITNTSPRARTGGPRFRTVVASQAYRIPGHRQSITQCSLPPAFFFDRQCVWVTSQKRSGSHVSNSRFGRFGRYRASTSESPTWPTWPTSASCNRSWGRWSSSTRVVQEGEGVAGKRARYGRPRT